MIDRTHDLPLVRQAALLRLNRSSLYYKVPAVPEADLVIMRRIDALHLDYPFAGSRMLRDLLRGEGVVIGREKVGECQRSCRLNSVTIPPIDDAAVLAA